MRKYHMGLRNGRQVIMFSFNKKKCTEETIGFIVKKKWNGNVWFLTVEYVVNGTVYKVKEQLTYHVTKKYYIGKIPVGMHSCAAIENTEVGTGIRVRYNPNKPKQSFLPDNNGHHIS